MVWLSGWSYRRKITITNDSNNNLTDYQVAIDLDGSNFDFTKANSDGSDIRFTDSDGETLLSYWIEEWDSANQTAKVWVKVPSIPVRHTKVESGSWTVDENVYHRRTKITITENSGQNLTDYQVKIVINTKWLVDNGYATPNGNEVRFTDSEGNPLNFWRETDFNLEETVYWVKVPSLPANSTKTIYIYYDEELTTVPDASDPTNTFIFFDDMETWSGWIQYGSGQVSQDSARKYDGQYSAHKTAANDPNGAYKDIGLTLGRDIALEFWVNRNSGYAGGSWDRVGLIDDTGNGYGWLFDHGDSQIGIDRRDNYTGTALVQPPATNYMDKWVFARFIIKSDGTLISEQYVDGVLDGQASTTDTTYSNFTRVYIFGGYDYWVDQIRIRKYVDPEPSVEVEMEGATQIYMYYGNPSAESLSNGDDTFIFFDDFEEGSLDTSKWTADNTNYSIGDSVINIPKGTTIHTNSFFSGNSVVRVKAKWNNFNWRVSYRVSDDGYHNAFGFFLEASGNDNLNYNSKVNDSWGTGVKLIDSSANTYYLMDIFHDGSSFHAEIYDSNFNLLAKGSNRTISDFSQAIYLYVNASIGSGDNTIMTVDYVFLRRYISPEPSYTIGSEETGGIVYELTLTESISPSDSIAKSPSKRLAESMSLTDNFSRVWNTNRVYSESLNLNDAISRETDKFLSESLSLSDIYTRTWIANRSLYDSLNLKDIITKSPSIKKGEILELVDTVSALRTLLQTLTEVLALSDRITKNPNVLKVEDIGLLDIHTKTTYKTHTESLAFQDTLQKEAGKVFVEILGLSDKITKSPSIVAFELLELKDTYAKIWDIYRTQSEVLCLRDTISKDAMISLEEVLQVLDTIAKSPSLRLSEILYLRDFTIKSPSKSFVEELTLYDSISTARVLVKILTEELLLKDTFSRVFNIQKSLVETLTLQDKISKKIDLHTLSEIINLYDYTKYGMNITRLAKLIRKLIQLEDLGGGWYEFR